MFVWVVGWLLFIIENVSSFARNETFVGQIFCLEKWMIKILNLCTGIVKAVLGTHPYFSVPNFHFVLLCVVFIHIGLPLKLNLNCTFSSFHFCVCKT